MGFGVKYGFWSVVKGRRYYCLKETQKGQEIWMVYWWWLWEYGLDRGVKKFGDGEREENSQVRDDFIKDKRERERERERER